MARPTEHGLSYFPLDVDFDYDDKYQMLLGRHTSSVIFPIILLHCKIYSEGYFYKWTEKEQLLLSRRAGVEKKLIIEYVESAVEFEIFDKEVFEKYSVLTSNGIQKRYFEAVKRRKEIIIIQEYIVNGNTRLLSEMENVNIKHISTGVIENINPQIKVNKSKVNKRESKVEEIQLPSLSDVRLVFKEHGKEKDAETFFNYYEANNWTTKAGQPIKNWKAAIKNWVKRDKNSEKEKKPEPEERSSYEQAVCKEITSIFIPSVLDSFTNKTLQESDYRKLPKDAKKRINDLINNQKQYCHD